MFVRSVNSILWVIFNAYLSDPITCAFLHLIGFSLATFCPSQLHQLRDTLLLLIYRKLPTYFLSRKERKWKGEVGGYKVVISTVFDCILSDYWISS